MATNIIIKILLEMLAFVGFLSTAGVAVLVIGMISHMIAALIVWICRQT
jgi:hypothetical protein